MAVVSPPTPPLQASWEECWWEASDWAGLKELGATKSGNTEYGEALSRVGTYRLAVQVHYRATKSSNTEYGEHVPLYGAYVSRLL